MARNFKLGALIIGAGRSGTTSLFEYLRQHPDINSSRIKEVHFFSFKELYERGIPYLSSFFGKGEGLKLMADTYAMIDEQAPQRLAAFDPSVKVIVMLREPGIRSFSNFRYARNFGYEKEGCDFMSAIKSESERLHDTDLVQRNNRCHLYGSLYAFHLKRWVHAQGKGNIFVSTLDNLQRDPQKLLSDLFAFLKLPDCKISALGARNSSAKARSKRLEQILLNRNRPLRKLFRKAAPSFLKKAIIRSGVVDSLHRINRQKANAERMPDNCRKYMDEYFRKDLEDLERDFGVRFSG